MNKENLEKICSELKKVCDEFGGISNDTVDLMVRLENNFLALAGIYKSILENEGDVDESDQSRYASRLYSEGIEKFEEANNLIDKLSDICENLLVCQKRIS